MKKLVALLAVLGFASSAHAAEGADFSHSGEFRLHYVNDINADMNDNSADSPDQNWHQRLRWGTAVRAGEKLSGHFTLVHNADWGSNGNLTKGADQVPSDATVSASATDTNNLLIVNEAYAAWVANDAWTFKFGRGSLTMADGRFVAANDNEDVSKAFDGVLASWDHDFARFNFFGVTGAKGTAFNTFGRFFGVSADFKSLPAFMKAAHLHYVQVKRDRGAYDLGTTVGSTLGKKDETRMGLMVSGDVSGFDWRANYEMEDGESHDYTTGVKTDVEANMFDLEFGYTFAAAMNTRIHAGYHMDSGDSNAADKKAETYDGFHYDRHNNAGLMDMFEWGNLTYSRLGFSLAPSDDITVGAEYLMFSLTEKKDGYRRFGTTVATANATTKDDLGNEIDLWVTKKYSNNFSITGRYATFAPGDVFGSNPDDVEQLYAEAKLTF